jgi:hypothetical protein
MDQYPAQTASALRPDADYAAARNCHLQLSFVIQPLFDTYSET